VTERASDSSWNGASCNDGEYGMLVEFMGIVSKSASIKSMSYKKSVDGCTTKGRTYHKSPGTAVEASTLASGISDSQRKGLAAETRYHKASKNTIEPRRRSIAQVAVRRHGLCRRLSSIDFIKNTPVILKIKWWRFLSGNWRSLPGPVAWLGASSLSHPSIIQSGLALLSPIIGHFAGDRSSVVWRTIRAYSALWALMPRRGGHDQ
jgi:hypothetical protein